MVLLDTINQSVIGRDAQIKTPYGVKPLIYADYTASGRSLSFIEDYVREQVLPFYANTHSDSAYTGAQMNEFYRQSKQMIRDSVNAGLADRVVFCGAGATSAINKVVGLLGLDQKSVNSAESSCSDLPVVFIGPYEHHSNELPWREASVELCVIPLDTTGGICLANLERKLDEYSGRELKIGSFSAASNVTGRLSDVPAITKLLKQSGALAFWDYAAAGPYVEIDMNAKAPIDAIFLSPHKFVGGPGTCGVLVAKQHVFKNQAPVRVGGGTVSFVTDHDHDYVTNLEAKEEGGTPAIVDAIRTGMVFRLKDQVGVKVIEARERAIVETVMTKLKAIDNVEVLGCVDSQRLPIFSFRIQARGKCLHYGYIVTLLNDLFGIQTRGGCSCAGPYGHYLLGLDSEQSDELRQRVNRGETLHRPGWVRFNINYFIDEAQMHYILDAIELVAEYGHRLLGEYQCCVNRGVWQHRAGHHTLANLDWQMPVSNDAQDKLTQEKCGADYSDLLHQAKLVLENACEQPCKGTEKDDLHHEATWFLMPDAHSG